MPSSTRRKTSSIVFVTIIALLITAGIIADQKFVSPTEDTTTEPAMDEVSEPAPTQDLETQPPVESTSAYLPDPADYQIDFAYYQNVFTDWPEDQILFAHRRLANVAPSRSCPQANTGRYDYQSVIDVSNGIGTYKPRNLINISSLVATKYPGLCLDALAGIYLDAMIEAAASDGVTIITTSAYRDRSTQNALYKANLREHPDQEIPSVAKPGYSEHQLGTTIDLTTPEINNASAATIFETTAAYRWLTEHAANYGFYLSYPPDNTLGYIYEPWHWRWWGF